MLLATPPPHPTQACKSWGSRCRRWTTWLKHPYPARSVLAHFPTLILFPNLYLAHQASTPLWSLLNRTVFTPGILEVLCALLPSQPSWYLFTFQSKLNCPSKSFPCLLWSLCHKHISPWSSLVQCSIFSFTTLEHNVYFPHSCLFLLLFAPLESCEPSSPMNPQGLA